ncbi:MAG: Txe/YoeB family addiction module toxin [Ferrimicrobium sp.]
MRLVFTPQGWEDYVYWQRIDRTVLKRVNRLIDDVVRDPTSGIGKPEQLRYGISHSWSRRITDEHRLVYQVMGEEIIILQARYHYGKW